MPIYVNNDQIQKIYSGDKEVVKSYLNSQVIYLKSTPTITLPSPTFATTWAERSGASSANLGTRGGTFTPVVAGPLNWVPEGSGHSLWTTSQQPIDVTSWTVMARYKMLAAPAVNGRYNFYGASSLFNFQFWQGDATTSAFEASGGTGGASAFVMPFNISTTQWVHLSLVCNGTTTAVYLDGVLHNRFLTKAPPMRGTQMIGTEGASRLLLKDFRMFDQPLTQEQVVLAMNTPVQ